MSQKSERQSASSGVAGLDDVLGGGFERRRLFLVEGTPGAGKTTLAVQFLLAGAAAGERVVYVTLSESEEELQGVARSHGWNLDGVEILELTADRRSVEPEEQSAMFHPSEVELAQTLSLLLADIERIDPSRIVFDSLSEMRLLAGNALRYRRQILALKRYFGQRDATVLLLDDLTATDHDLQVQSIAHGVLALEQLSPEYGSDRRRLRVIKYRGTAFRGGFHDYTIRRGGLEIFPRLVASEHPQLPGRERIPSGIAALDELLGGGLEKGTSTLFVGAAGTGKSTIAAQFASHYVAHGGRAAIFIFDENAATLRERADAMDIGLGEALDSGGATLRQIDPAELSPGEFTHAIRREVDSGAGMVVIDSLNGYLNAMPGERFLSIQLHELLAYLGQRNVATLLLSAHQGLIGTQMTSPVDASYLADAIVLLRYFEAGGEVRQAISVMKKRGSRHERTIREFRFGESGLEVGEPLRHFRGILTGVPVPRDAESPPRKSEA
jgi:circadian clock protein KaiC